MFQNIGVRLETLIFEFAGSKPIRSKVLLIRGLFLLFLISLYKAAFLSCACYCLRSAASLLCKFCSFANLLFTGAIIRSIIIANLLFSLTYVSNIGSTFGGTFTAF